MTAFAESLQLLKPEQDESDTWMEFENLQRKSPLHEKPLTTAFGELLQATTPLHDPGSTWIPSEPSQAPSPMQDSAIGEGVGESVGDGVGESVGDGVGESVGEGVGESVGEGVGEWVGSSRSNTSTSRSCRKLLLGLSGNLILTLSPWMLQPGTRISITGPGFSPTGVGSLYV